MIICSFGSQCARDLGLITHVYALGGIRLDFVTTRVRDDGSITYQKHSAASPSCLAKRREMML